MKQIIKDLEFAFNREFKMQSQHILLIGDLTFKNLINDSVLDFEDDRSNRFKKLLEVLKNVEMLRFIDLQKEVKKRTEEGSAFLDTYCSSVKGEKLGYLNIRYKASEKTKILTKSRNKFYKYMKLNCIHSTDLISKNI